MKCSVWETQKGPSHSSRRRHLDEVETGSSTRQLGGGGWPPFSRGGRKEKGEKTFVLASGGKHSEIQKKRKKILLFLFIHPLRKKKKKGEDRGRCSSKHKRERGTSVDPCSLSF